MALSNDERGWVMTGLSGLACIVGASVICVDVIIRQFPGKRDFRIQDSDTFLSASLSLSFGVMLFSSLYSMLPSAKSSLEKGGFSPKHAAWTLIACFIGGVVGIQVISTVLHRFIPTHVVDCEHSHNEDEDEEAKADGELPDHTHEPPSTPKAKRKNSLPGHMPQAPRGPRADSQSGSYFRGDHLQSFDGAVVSEAGKQPNNLQTPGMPARRPSLHQRFTAGISSIATPKHRCDGDGPCHGFTDPCGEECFKKLKARGGARASFRRSSSSLRPAMTKSQTAQSIMVVSESTPLLHDITEEPARPVHTQPAEQFLDVPGHRQSSDSQPRSGSSSEQNMSNGHNHHNTLHKTPSYDSTSSAYRAAHHHHVPNNAFLSIGLQTSIAIAVHKLPEGFITYATNHANPKLGLAVFLALFIHNITEGFALALPLYLAINSRWKAMVISFVLGGLSQPLGAGVAALWFKLAGKSDWAPSEGVYGGMFAVTAGIMANVALQLFSESLDLTHSRTLCMVGAFSGMAILGISSALTA